MDPISALTIDPSTEMARKTRTQEARLKEAIELEFIFAQKKKVSIGGFHSDGQTPFKYRMSHKEDT